MVASRLACIHSQNTCDISTLETYYLNFIASEINPQKSLKCSGFVKKLVAYIVLCVPMATFLTYPEETPEVKWDKIKKL